MRRLIRYVVLAVVLMLGVVMPVTPVAVAAPALTVANAASLQENPVASGALLTITTPRRVSTEENWSYDPWVMQARDGLWVDATCSSRSHYLRLPISSVATVDGVNRITVYYPNDIGTEPYGLCPNQGLRKFRVFSPETKELITGEAQALPAHPGIFSVTLSPKGDHVDATGRHTTLADCRTRLATDPKACPVRVGGISSELWVMLTGAEWFRCDPCVNPAISFQLALAPDAPDSAWIPQELQRLTSVSTGIEQAVIRLLPDTAPGSYYLRVRNTARPEFPTPLRVDFGQPV